MNKTRENLSDTAVVQNTSSKPPIGGLRCKAKTMTNATKAKGNKRIQVSPVFIEKRKQSQDNITSEFGILARMNRSIQVEGAFGVIKENHNFRRFLTRGKKNVKVEFTLLALAYNLNKLHNKIQQNRLGVSFYTKEIA